MNTKSAKNVKEFVVVMSRDDKDRPNVLRMPGHKGRTYIVTFVRNGCVSANCTRINAHVACQGNSHSVCYHILAACEVAAEDVGLELSWCNSQADAERLARIEGRTFCVESAQSKKRAWGVVKGHKPLDLLVWADELEDVNRYDADIVRKIAEHNPESNAASLDALGQLLGKYPERQANLAALFPEAILKIGRSLLRGEGEVEL